MPVTDVPVSKLLCLEGPFEASRSRLAAAHSPVRSLGTTLAAIAALQRLAAYTFAGGVAAA